MLCLCLIFIVHQEKLLCQEPTCTSHHLLQARCSALDPQVEDEDVIRRKVRMDSLKDNELLMLREEVQRLWEAGANDRGWWWWPSSQNRLLAPSSGENPDQEAPLRVCWSHHVALTSNHRWGFWFWSPAQLTKKHHQYFRFGFVLSLVLSTW